MVVLKIREHFMKDKENYIKCNIDCTILFSRPLIVIIQYFTESKCRKSKYFETKLI